MAIALGAVLLGGWIWTRKGGEQPPRVVHPTLSLDWPLQRRANYDFSWESRAEAEQLDPDTGSEKVSELSRILVVGALSLQRVPVAGKGWALQATLSDPQIQIRLEDDRTPPSMDVLQDELSQPFVIELDRRGLVRVVRLPRELGTTGFSVFKSVAALLQRPTPPASSGWTHQDPNETSWEGVEADLTGKARFLYQATPSLLEKEKLEYVSLVEGGGPAAMAMDDLEVTVVHSRHIHQMGETWQSPPQAITVEEATRVELGGAFAPMKSSVSMSLTRKAMTKSAAITRELPKGLVAAKLDQMPPEEAQQRERAQEAIGGRSLSDLKKVVLDLERLVPRNRRAEARAFSTLTSKLRIDEQARQQAVADIRADKDRMLLLDALGSAGTPATQAILVQLIDEIELGREQTRSTLINLSMSQEPTPATVEALRKRKDDPTHGTQATFGLGSAAHSLKETHPAEAVELVEELVDDLNQPANQQKAAATLKALGNAGSSLGLPACEKYIHDDNLQLRLAATECARMVDGPRADSLLAISLRDPQDTVTRAAIYASLHRSYSSILVGPLQELVLGTRTKGIRIAATQVLGKWAKSAPELHATLAEIAKNDPEEELRSYAEKLLRKASDSR